MAAYTQQNSQWFSEIYYSAASGTKPSTTDNLVRYAYKAAKIPIKQDTYGYYISSADLIKEPQFALTKRIWVF